MQFFVLVGRYLGLMVGRDVSHPVSPIADPNGMYAVLRVSEGLLAAPANYAPLFQIAARAPWVSDAHAVLAVTEHDPSVSFARLAEDMLLFVLDEEGLPEDLLDDLIVLPGQEIRTLGSVGGAEPDDPNAVPSWRTGAFLYEVGERQFCGYPQVVDTIRSLEREGTALRDLADRIEARPGGAGKGYGAAPLTFATDFRAHLASGAVDVMLK